MNLLYSFKWPLIFFAIGLLFEKLYGIEGGKDISENFLIAGYWLQMLALVIIVWKLLFVEKK